MPRAALPAAPARARATSRRRLPFGFDPRTISIVEGIRAGLAAAVPVAASVWFGQPALTIAALGALLTCICDPAGPMRRRLPLLLAFIVTGGLTLGGFGLIRAGGVPLTIAIAAPSLFACAFLRIWGQPAQALGNLLAVLLILGTDAPLDLPHAATHAALFTAGGAWALFLTLVIWRIHPYGPARRAVADVWVALADLARTTHVLVTTHAPPDAWARESRIGRSTARDAIEYTRTVLMDTLQASGPASGPAAQNLLRLEAADQVFAVLVGLSDVLEQSEPATSDTAADLLRRLRGLLTVIGRATEREQLDRLPRTDRTLAHLAHDPELASCLRPFATKLTERLRLATKYVDPAQYIPGSGIQGDSGIPLREQLSGPLEANLTWQSASLRHATRIAAVVTPALAISLYRHGPYTHWVTITLVLVMQPFYATTRQRSVERIAASLFGGSVAMALSLGMRSRLHVASMLPALGALALAVRQVNYGVYIAVYTPTVILLVENTIPIDSFWRTALARAGFTVLGGVLAVAANMLLWPTWEPDRVRADLRTALAAHAAYAAAVLNPSPDHDPEAARRAAGLSSNNLEASLARALQEPRRGQRDRFEAVMVADATLRRIGGRLVALSLAGTTGGPVSRWVVEATAALASGAPLPPAPATESGTMVDRLARQVALLPEILARGLVKEGQG